jgi:TatA/E family protein of Tat protein translocase
MFDIGGGELLFIVVLIVILFGPKKLPELMQGLGRGMREFKKAQREFTDQINTAFDDEHRKNYRRNQRDINRGDANAIPRNADPAKTEYEAEMKDHDRDVMEDVDTMEAPPQNAPEGTTPRTPAPANGTVSTDSAEEGTDRANDTNNQNI